MRAVVAALWCAALATAAAEKRCRRFVIISEQRSGSRYFIAKLDTHPNIRATSEIFSHGRWKNATMRQMHEAINSHMAAACAYDPRSSHTTKNKMNITTVGFKWMVNQGMEKKHEKIARYFAKSGTKIIYLWRRNTVRRLVSLHVLTELSRSAHPRDATQVHAIKTTRVALPTNRSLARFLERVVRERRHVESWFQNLPSVAHYYEDAVEAAARYNETFSSISRFLGVAPFAFPRSKYLAIHAGQPMLAAVQNDVCLCAEDERPSRRLAISPRGAAVPGFPAQVAVLADLLAFCNCRTERLVDTCVTRPLASSLPGDSARDQPDALPPGWHEVMDTNSGSPYYVSPDSVAQWERPGADGAASSAWHKAGSPSQGCDWVADAREARCGFSRGDRGARGADGAFASDACPVCARAPTFLGPCCGVNDAICDDARAEAARLSLGDDDPDTEEGCGAAKCKPIGWEKPVGH